MNMSKNLNERQVRGLAKMGDVLVPGDEDLKSFSASGCVSEADRILDHMPLSDLKDLKMLLTLMSFFPMFLVAWFLAFLERSPRMPDWIGAPLRFVRLGIRGLVLTLYYSHPQAHQVLGYKVGVYTADMQGQDFVPRPVVPSEKLKLQPPVSGNSGDYRSF
jgi:hypothetical protein